MKIEIMTKSAIEKLLKEIQDNDAHYSIYIDINQIHCMRKMIFSCSMINLTSVMNKIKIIVDHMSKNIID